MAVASKRRAALRLLPAQCCAPVTGPQIDKDAAVATAEVFKALADPSRVKIVNVLANHPESVCVCDITAAVGLSQPTVSFHLKRLTSAGLLEREQRGVWGYYRLNRAALERLSTIFKNEEQGGEQ